MADTEDKDEQLHDLKETIKDLEDELQRNKSIAREVREDCEQAVREKERALEDLEEVSTTWDCASLIVTNPSVAARSDDR